MIKIIMTVHTPKNQAAQCIKTFKDKILTIKQAQKMLKKQELTSHNLFKWHLELETEKDYEQIIKKAAKADFIIKKFYRTLYKWIHRANKVANKFKKGTTWIKKWLIKQITKKSQDSQDLTNYIQNTTDTEFKNLLTIDDQTDMDRLLNRDSTIIINRLTTKLKE